MTSPSAPSVVARSGGAVLVDNLRLHGGDTVFGVPGESFLPVLDGLYEHREHMRFVSCRQEGNAGHMAEAWAKLTGRPGVCIVTRGPGATNASIAVHTAKQDSTPLILLAGQVRRGVLGREAWQEIDFPAVFGSMAKWCAQVERPERIPELLARAFQVATSGRPGPVVLALPEDVLYETVSVADAAPFTPVRTHPPPEAMEHLECLLAAAERPILLLGGGGWDAAACAAIQRFAEAFDLPVCTGFRRQDLFDNRHHLYAGDLGIGANPALSSRVRQADLIVCVGARMGETTTADYSMLRVPRPAQRLVHVHADAAELGRVYQAELYIHADMVAFAAAAENLAAPSGSRGRHDWSAMARADYDAWLQPTPMPGTLNLAHAMATLRAALPADAIVTNGAGNYAGWLHRFFSYAGFRTQLAPTSGVMGYGLPAACAAALRYPERTVVCIAGDGCLQMSIQELATVRQLGLRMIILVVDNGSYGSIRMHQELHYPERVIGTELQNPDFVRLAEAYGLAGESVKHDAQFAQALERALGRKNASLLALDVDPQALTPTRTVDGIRRAARA